MKYKGVYYLKEMSVKILKNNIIHAVLGTCIVFTNIQLKGMDDFVLSDEKRSLKEKIDDIKQYLSLPDSKENPQAQLQFLMKLYPLGHPYHEALVEVIKEKWLIAKKERAKKEQEVAVRTPVRQPQVRKNTIPSTNNQHAVRQQVKGSPMPTVRIVQPMQDLSKRHTGVLRVGAIQPRQQSTIKTASVDLGINGLNAENKAKLKNIGENLKIDQIFIYQEGTVNGFTFSKSLAEKLSNLIENAKGDENIIPDLFSIPVQFNIQTVQEALNLAAWISAHEKDPDFTTQLADRIKQLSIDLSEISGVAYYLEIPSIIKYMGDVRIHQEGNYKNGFTLSKWIASSLSDTIKNQLKAEEVQKSHDVIFILVPVKYNIEIVKKVFDIAKRFQEYRRGFSDRDIDQLIIELAELPLAEVVEMCNIASYFNINCISEDKADFFARVLCKKLFLISSDYSRLEYICYDYVKNSTNTKGAEVDILSTPIEGLEQIKTPTSGLKRYRVKSLEDIEKILSQMPNLKILDGVDLDYLRKPNNYFMFDRLAHGKLTENFSLEDLKNAVDRDWHVKILLKGLRRHFSLPFYRRWWNSLG